jgi:hypothetical protein
MYVETMLDTLLPAMGVQSFHGWLGGDYSSLM